VGGAGEGTYRHRGRGVGDPDLTSIPDLKSPADTPAGPYVSGPIYAALELFHLHTHVGGSRSSI
jgi:hypothetical protein